MYPVSQQFLQALRGPHRVVSKVEYSDNPKSGNWVPLKYPVSDGQVTIARNDVRRSLELTLAHVFDPTEAAQGQLNAYTGFLRVSRGLNIPGMGGPEYARLGVFRIHDVEIHRDMAKIEGFSLEQDIKDARFTQPWIWSWPADVKFLIGLMLLDANIQAPFTWDAALWNPTVQPTLFEKDRLDAINELVTSAGGEFFASATGELVARKPGVVTDPPVWFVDSGPEGVLVDYAKRYSRQGTYNGVVVSNETIDLETPPIRAIVWDNNPASPTYYLGKFGKVPRFFTSQFINTFSQARSVGFDMLAKEKGLNFAIDFSLVPNPALDVNDVITVVYPDGQTENHLIDSIDVGLGASDGMSASTRTIQTPEEL